MTSHKKELVIFQLEIYWEDAFCKFQQTGKLEQSCISPVPSPPCRLPLCPLTPHILFCSVYITETICEKENESFLKWEAIIFHCSTEKTISTFFLPIFEESGKSDLDAEKLNMRLLSSWPRHVRKGQFWQNELPYRNSRSVTLKSWDCT